MSDKNGTTQPDIPISPELAAILKLDSKIDKLVLFIESQEKRIVRLEKQYDWLDSRVSALDGI